MTSYAHRALTAGTFDDPEVLLKAYTGCRTMTQPNFFNAQIAPLRRIIYNVKISVTHSKLQTNSYPYKSIMDLVHMHEALLSGDPIALRLAGITPQMAEEIIHRLQTASRAMTRRANGS